MVLLRACNGLVRARREAQNTVALQHRYMVLSLTSFDNRREGVSSGDKKEDVLLRGASMMTGFPNRKCLSKKSDLPKSWGTRGIGDSTECGASRAFKRA